MDSISSVSQSNEYLTSSVYKADYSAEKKEEVFDTVIDELYQEPGTFIRSSDDFWNFFNDTSSAIPIFEPDDRSHQYLVDNAILESGGEIIVWTDGTSIIRANDIGQITQDSASLAVQVKVFLDTQAGNPLSIDIPNGSFESWTTGSLDGWNKWINPMPNPMPITGVDGGAGVRITKTEYFTPTTGAPNLVDRHSAINSTNDNSLWLIAFETYKLSGFYKTHEGGNGQVFVGDTRGGADNNSNYIWRKYVTFDSVTNWTPFEMIFIPVPNIYTYGSPQTPYRGCMASIYLYSGMNDANFYSWADYDNLKLERLTNYTGSNDTTYADPNQETGSVTDPIEELIAPQLNSPEINEVIDGQFSLTWSSNYDFFDIYVAQNSSFTTNVETKLNHLGLTVPFGDVAGNNYLDWDMRVYWKVRARNLNGNVGDWSDTWYFNTPDQDYGG